MVSHFVIADGQGNTLHDCFSLLRKMSKLRDFQKNSIRLIYLYVFFVVVCNSLNTEPKAPAPVRHPLVPHIFLVVFVSPVLAGMTGFLSVTRVMCDTRLGHGFYHA